MIPLYLEAQPRLCIKALIAAAAAELAQDQGHDASWSLSILRMLIDDIAAAQYENTGGLPEKFAHRTKPHEGNTHHSDAGTANACIAMLEGARDIEQHGGKLAEVVPPDELRAIAKGILDNAERTVDALGGLPSQTDAADPTLPTKQRVFEPRDAIDTIATTSMLSAACYYLELTGDDHPIRAKLQTILSDLRARFAGEVPRFVQTALIGVYGTDDGREVYDKAEARPGYRWETDGSEIDTQLKRAAR